MNDRLIELQELKTKLNNQVDELNKTLKEFGKYDGVVEVEVLESAMGYYSKNNNGFLGYPPMIEVKVYAAI